ncbi:TonB-dependent receptor [Lysobacter sp. SG-8]|uniref:TonB-dependent receptor n=1 Tax=Marilutibacter penaei TaxID=2759900 RepID=A0A7W3U2N0_9GAMM|nr:TonB-dependent receptor [Lysobacter penaei]MBB1087784.1 TonB-dependent receptor [Lysobacter penaei]
MQTVRAGQRKASATALAIAIAFALQAAPHDSRAQESSPSTSPANPAAEQDPQTTELDSVVVTGFRGSLEQALDIKRGEVGAVDAIVAEDVAEFPDLNLAESLQRIPGVAIDRDAGEGRSISVRGLGPQFTRVRLNGMEALATGGGTDSSGGVNRGRGFDFNTFASELFSEMVVRKTSDASTEEGSLGATIDLRTARPFDYDGFTFAAGGQYGYSDLSGDSDPRASALISNTFADGRFGALLSVAYTQRSLVEEGHSTVRWDRGTSNGGFDPSSPFVEAGSADVFHPRIPRYGVMQHDQERVGATGSLQFRPTDNIDLALDVLYATFDADRTEDYFEAVSFSRSGAGKPATVVLDGEVRNNNLVYGVFDNVDIRSESRTDEQDTEFLQWGFSGDIDFTDSFDMSFLVGQSTSTYDNPVQTTVIMDKFDADGYVYDYRGSSRLPDFNYGSVDPLDPNGWTLAEIRLRPQWVENSFDNAQLDFRWVASSSFTLRGGVNYKDFTYESREWRRASESAVPVLDAATLATMLKEAGLEDIDVSSNRWVVPDVGAFDDMFDIYSNSGLFEVSDSLSNVAANNRTVNEEDTGFYLQGDFGFDLGSMPVNGNVGVRHIKTELTSDGYSFVGGVAVPTRVTHEYSDTLPSLNLVGELTPDVLLRFSAAKVMARPNLGFLNPGATVSVSGGARTVTTGNPKLDPFRATTFDLGLEWYFSTDALLGVAVFYKDIDSFIQTSRETRPFNTSGLPDSLLVGTGASPTDDFDFTQPLNTPGGDLTGYEINYQHPFTEMGGWLQNFGVLFSYTHVESEIQYLSSSGAPAAVGPMTGQSENSASGTLFYDDGKLSARASVSYRDAFLTTIPGRNGNDVEGTKETTTVDASVSYRINDNWQISLEGLNLTDEWSDQWVDSVGDRSSVYTHTGRQYLLGFRYKY